MTERVGLAKADFVIKQDNVLPEIRATLLDANNDPINLAGSTVRFHMKSQNDGALVVDALAAILVAATGRVEYAWAAGDTDEAGWMDIEWEITDVGLDVTTVPSFGYDKVFITARLA